MSDTPRVDAMAYDSVNAFTGRKNTVVRAAFARVLERELAEANAKLDAARNRADEAIRLTRELIELHKSKP